MRIRDRILLVVVLLLAFASPALAATGKRVALVIGNGAYQNAVALPNPANDAADVAKKLRDLGFTVIEGLDLTRDEMEDRLREFAEVVNSAELTLFFYAGHGMQVDGRNYLIPVDAQLQNATSLAFETIDADVIFSYMGGDSRVALAFLDACRDNPLSRRFAQALPKKRGSIGVGLAAPDTAGTGLFIGFSTSPGDVAADGSGRNSPFTTALLNNIDTPGLELQQVMNRVKAEVQALTGNSQRPWTNSDLAADVFIVPATAVADTGPVTKPVEPAVSEEDFAWELVKTSRDPAAVKAFIQRFPTGERFDEALALLTEINASGTAPVDAPRVADVPATPEVKVEPQDDTPAPDPRTLVVAVQEELRRAGCNPGGADGDWGNRSRGALGRFSRDAGLDISDMQPDGKLLDLLKSRPGVVCKAEEKPVVTEKKAPDTGGTRSASKEEEPVRSSGCYDVRVSVMPYPTGEDWDPWPGNRANPDPEIRETTTGAQTACTDSFNCGLRVEGAGRSLSFVIVDGDPDAADPIGSGSCKAGGSCKVGLARLSMSAC